MFPEHLKLPCLDEDNNPIPDCKRVDQLTQLLLKRQQSLMSILVFEQQMLDEAGDVSVSDIEHFHQHFDDVLGEEYIEWSVYKADLTNFCKIDVINLTNGKTGKINQAQMWGQLKTHGKFKTLLNIAVPEPLQTTLEKKGINKSGTLAKQIQSKVQISEEEKLRIKDLQKEFCVKLTAQGTKELLKEFFKE
jgi:hypothetical protein